MTRPIYAIVGPTAAGKTRVAFELARSLDGEVISVDSRQVYRYLDVGTDKISREEAKVVPHHLIDVANPDEVFTAADFVERAEDAVDWITSRGKLPILAGGTPMYYRALEGGMLSKDLPSDDAVREDLERMADEFGSAAVHDELASVDPERASRIHPNDRVRIVRALELFRITGLTATELFSSREKIGVLKIFYFGVKTSRENLYRKIESRAARQFDSGYPEEVRWLLDNGYGRDLPSMRGFGYRELAAFLCGEMSLREALEGDIRSTKAFSRRQMTWFSQFSPILWYDFSELSFDSAVNDMAEKIKRCSKRWS